MCGERYVIRKERQAWIRLWNLTFRNLLLPNWTFFHKPVPALSPKMLFLFQLARSSKGIASLGLTGTCAIRITTPNAKTKRSDGAHIIPTGLMLVIVHCLMLREQHTLLSYSEPEVKKKDPSAPLPPPRSRARCVHDVDPKQTNIYKESHEPSV